MHSANRVWLNDNPAGLIYQFNAEGEKLAPEINERSPRVYSIAADHENHDLYEGDNFFDIIGIYSSTGAPVSSFGTAGGGISIAVDNSVPPTAGRIYIAHGVEFGGGTRVVESLSENGEAIPFADSAKYIEGDEISGTPSGHFTNPSDVAVGPSGEIYVVDTGQVDEFKSSGEFIRELVPGSSGVPNEFNPGRIAVDPTTGDLLTVSGERSSMNSPPPVLTSGRSRATGWKVGLPPVPLRSTLLGFSMSSTAVQLTSSARASSSPR